MLDIVGVFRTRFAKTSDEKVWTRVIDCIANVLRLPGRHNTINVHWEPEMPLNMKEALLLLLQRLKLHKTTSHPRAFTWISPSVTN